MRSYATVCPAVCGEASSSSGGGRAFLESKRLPSATAHITPITCVKPAGRQRDSFFSSAPYSAAGCAHSGRSERSAAGRCPARRRPVEHLGWRDPRDARDGLAGPEWGNPRVIRVAATALCASCRCCHWPSMLLLMLALFIFGIGFGLLDVSMNVQAVAVEEGYGRPIMSTFHGVFSIGGLLGAASAGLIAGAGVAPLPHLLAVALVLLVLVAVASVHCSTSGLPTTAYRCSRSRRGRSSVSVSSASACFSARVRWPTGARSTWRTCSVRPGHRGDRLCRIVAGDGRRCAWRPHAFRRRAAGPCGRSCGGPGDDRRAADRHDPGRGDRIRLCRSGIGGCLSDCPRGRRPPGLASGTAIGAVATAGYTGLLVGAP